MRHGSELLAVTITSSSISNGSAISSARSRLRCTTIPPSWTAPTSPGGTCPSSTAHSFTDHFGLVSDFLAEAWAQLRSENRLQEIQGRVRYGGALSGQSTTAVNKTFSDLLKLIYPDRTIGIADEDLEWAVRLLMECRRRAKEQQKRIGSAEFCNTHFSYQMGDDRGRAVRAHA